MSHEVYQVTSANALVIFSLRPKTTRLVIGIGRCGGSTTGGCGLSTLAASPGRPTLVQDERSSRGVGGR